MRYTEDEEEQQDYDAGAYAAFFYAPQQLFIERFQRQIEHHREEKDPDVIPEYEEKPQYYQRENGQEQKHENPVFPDIEI
jgi:hypothetical protein